MVNDPTKVRWYKHLPPRNKGTYGRPIYGYWTAVQSVGFKDRPGRVLVYHNRFLSGTGYYHGYSWKTEGEGLPLTLGFVEKTVPNIKSVLRSVVLWANRYDIPLATHDSYGRQPAVLLPGTYFIGDVGYLTELESTEMSDWWHYTAHGDGEYEDDHANQYGVDCGVLGAHRVNETVEDVQDGDDWPYGGSGRIWQFDQPFCCRYDGGVFRFGEIVIDTIECAACLEISFKGDPADVSYDADDYLCEQHTHFREKADA